MKNISMVLIIITALSCSSSTISKDAGKDISIAEIDTNSGEISKSCSEDLWKNAEAFSIYNAHCTGNKGCTEMNPVCGQWRCILCDNETCLLASFDSKCPDQDTADKDLQKDNIVPDTDSIVVPDAEDSNIQEIEDTAVCQQTPEQGADKYNADCKDKKGCVAVITNCVCGCTLCSNETCIQFECLTNCTDTIEDTVLPDVNDAKDTNISDSQDAADSKDVPPQDTFEESIYCEDIYANPKKIGQECTDDCECETGYCYDEKYMSPFRFCTQECAGVVKGCPNPENEKIYECLIFGTAHKDTYNLTVMSMCMPKCYDLDDCKAVSDKYAYCPGKSFTEWEGITIGGSSCQTSKQ